MQNFVLKAYKTAYVYATVPISMHYVSDHHHHQQQQKTYTYFTLRQKKYVEWIDWMFDR